MPVGPRDWNALTRNAEDLIETDTHGFPKINRDLEGLYQSSQAARFRTSKFAGQQEQAAATRVLANTGFDASRLQQDVSLLELQPTVEDVFHADTANVDDYLQQIQDMTIIAAIQEAQQDTLLNFERYMEECLQREWQGDKSRLFGIIAPHTGLGAAGGAGPGQALGFGRITNLPPAGTTFAGAPKQAPLQDAYVQAVKTLVADWKRSSDAPTVDPIAQFGAASAVHEDKGHDTLMSSCWSLLSDILAVARARGGGADERNKDKYTEALLQGARQHLERGFASHLRGIISRHRLAAARGGDPDQLRDVQAYLAVKLRDKGPLDFQQAGGQDTSWIQLYHCLRAGMLDEALRAADRCLDLAASRASSTSIKSLVQHWMEDRNGFRTQYGAGMQQQCDRLLQGYSQRQGQLKYDYQVLVYCLLAGDSASLEALFKQNPGLFSTLEDYIWAKLMLVSQAPSGAASASGSSKQAGGGFASSSYHHPSSSGAGAVYRLSDLQADLNRWPSDYYSKQGKEPLLYLTVLLLSLQFRAGVKFLWKDDSTKAYRLDAVHLAIALYLTKVLQAETEGKEGPLTNQDLCQVVAEFGQQFTYRDSETALYYYMLAAEMAGDSKIQGRLFRELLVASKDYGTLLGAGGPTGHGGALQAFIREPGDRQKLFAAVAYDCQTNQQLEEARELFMAADKPLMALAIIIQQLSQAIARDRGPAASGQVPTLLSRGQAAVQALAGSGAGTDEPGRQAVDAFHQLSLLQQIMEVYDHQQWAEVLQLADKLPFIPSETSRVSLCSKITRELSGVVRERLGELLLAMTDAMVKLKDPRDAPSQTVLSARVKALKNFALTCADVLMLPAEVFQRINVCWREFGL